MMNDPYEYKQDYLEYTTKDGLQITEIFKSEFIGGLKVYIDEVGYIDSTEVYLTLQTKDINTSRECEDLQHALRLIQEVNKRIINNDSNESIIEYITSVAY